jgi:8-oxo-dGTP diphosphatase
VRLDHLTGVSLRRGRTAVTDPQAVGGRPDVHVERYTEAMLRVIAAAVIGPRGLLLVSKRAAPDVFYLPGGKPDPGEAPLDCLRRELREELGVGVGSTRPFEEVRSRAALEGVEMWMTVFLTRLTGVPAPAAEIAALRWWPHEPALGLAPAVRDYVIPSLRRSGLLRRGPRR